MFCYFIPASEYDLQPAVMVDADAFDHLADDGVIIYIDAGRPAINRSLYLFQAFLFTWVLFSFFLSRVYSALQLIDFIGNPPEFILMMFYAFSGLDACTDNLNHSFIQCFDPPFKELDLFCIPSNAKGIPYRGLHKRNVGTIIFLVEFPDCPDNRFLKFPFFYSDRILLLFNFEI